MRLGTCDRLSLCLIAFVIAAAAQQNGAMGALYQAFTQQSFDGGRYQGMFTPTPEKMLERVDRTTIQQLVNSSNTLQHNPNDGNALVLRGYAALSASGQSMYKIFWLHFAAKNLERAIQLDPNNFYARHNYAETCFQTGDQSDAQPVMHLAVAQFTKAIQLKPDSARSYMGRGWAYLMLDDQPHAQADFRRALQLDPQLQPELQKEASAIQYRRSQKGCAEAVLRRMGAYVVNRNARTYQQCQAVKGFWTGSECRISTALAPGPLALGPKDAATGNPGPEPPNCGPPPNATDYKYSPRAGGYVVR